MTRAALPLLLLSACGGPDRTQRKDPGTDPPTWVDRDGDGFGAGEDCDDLNPSIYPGAPDAWYDGVDSNCDGADDDDQDGDGFPLDRDCDDTEPEVYAIHERVCGDGLDNDCDGFGDCEYLYDVDATTEASFVLTGHVPAGCDTCSFDFGDVNGDGTLDLLTGGGRQEDSWLLFDVDLGAPSASTSDADLYFTGASNPTLLDVNDDGFDDIVVTADPIIGEHGTWVFLGPDPDPLQPEYALLLNEGLNDMPPIGRTAPCTSSTARWGACERRPADNHALHSYLAPRAASDGM